MMRRLPFLVATATLLVSTTHARADHIQNSGAVFAALDKVTAHISTLNVAVGQTVTFGSLKVTPRVCYTREATEAPNTTSFVEVDEVQLDGSEKRIFSGWMFAESPGLNAVEHPVFDVWLTGCEKPIAGAARGGSGDSSGEPPIVRPRPRR